MNTPSQPDPGNMSTPQPTSIGNNYQPPLHLGGTLVMPSPLPDVRPYPLRKEDFLTLCDGEVSVSRSLRDVCIGAAATGVVGVAGILITMDWEVAKRNGNHPIAWTIILCTLTGIAVLAGTAEWIRMWQTKTHSSYGRLVAHMSEYFKLDVTTPKEMKGE